MKKFSYQNCSELFIIKETMFLRKTANNNKKKKKTMIQLFNDNHLNAILSTI